ncbi:MAG: ChbG/HpnK family deacetylase [Gaiellales bacterium]
MRIVLNADDFGASADTLAATIECFELDALTSATIMVAMPETRAALDYALTRPEHGFGVHLQLVGDGIERPVSDPASVPTLVDEDGRLLPTGVVRKRAMLRRLSSAELQREIEAQLDIAVSAGLAVTHVDSHRHLHKVAQVCEALARALPRFGLRRVRRVQDVFLRRPLKTPTYWVGPWWQRGLARSFATTDHFYMPSSAHDLGWAEALAHRLPALRGATLEVGVHPGAADGWRADEGASVVAFANLARELGHELVTWRDL